MLYHLNHELSLPSDQFGNCFTPTLSLALPNDLLLLSNGYILYAFNSFTKDLHQIDLPTSRIRSLLYLPLFNAILVASHDLNFIIITVPTSSSPLFWSVADVLRSNCRTTLKMCLLPSICDFPDCCYFLAANTDGIRIFCLRKSPPYSQDDHIFDLNIVLSTSHLIKDAPDWPLSIGHYMVFDDSNSQGIKVFVAYQNSISFYSLSHQIIQIVEKKARNHNNEKQIKFFLEKLDNIRNFSFSITNVYHFSLNSTPFFTVSLANGQVMLIDEHSILHSTSLISPCIGICFHDSSYFTSPVLSLFDSTGHLQIIDLFLMTCLLTGSDQGCVLEDSIVLTCNGFVNNHIDYNQNHQSKQGSAHVWLVGRSDLSCFKISHPLRLLSYESIKICKLSRVVKFKNPKETKNPTKTSFIQLSLKEGAFRLLSFKDSNNDVIVEPSQLRFSSHPNEVLEAFFHPLNYLLVVLTFNVNVLDENGKLTDSINFDGNQLTSCCCVLSSVSTSGTELLLFDSSSDSSASFSVPLVVSTVDSKLHLISIQENGKLVKISACQSPHIGKIISIVTTYPNFSPISFISLDVNGILVFWNNSFEPINSILLNNFTSLGSEPPKIEIFGCDLLICNPKAGKFLVITSSMIFSCVSGSFDKSKRAQESSRKSQFGITISDLAHSIENSKNSVDRFVLNFDCISETNCELLVVCCASIYLYKITRNSSNSEFYGDLLLKLPPLADDYVDVKFVLVSDKLNLLITTCSKIFILNLESFVSKNSLTFLNIPLFDTSLGGFMTHDIERSTVSDNTTQITSTIQREIRKKVRKKKEKKKGTQQDRTLEFVNQIPNQLPSNHVQIVQHAPFSPSRPSKPVSIEHNSKQLRFNDSFDENDKNKLEGKQVSSGFANSQSFESNQRTSGNNDQVLKKNQQILELLDFDAYVDDVKEINNEILKDSVGCSNIINSDKDCSNHFNSVENSNTLFEILSNPTPNIEKESLVLLSTPDHSSEARTKPKAKRKCKRKRQKPTATVKLPSINNPSSISKFPNSPNVGSPRTSRTVPSNRRSSTPLFVRPFPKQLRQTVSAGVPLLGSPTKPNEATKTVSPPIPSVPLVEITSRDHSSYPMSLNRKEMRKSGRENGQKTNTEQLPKLSVCLFKSIRGK
ncbi:hypothetical protein P9112_007105 [Eukaryota sp. TZLM1-RC]